MSDFFAEATASFLGPIHGFLQDKNISEIMINGFDTIYIEIDGQITRTEKAFASEVELMAAIRRIAQMVGRRIDETSPILDARLHDGSRVHVVLKPNARKGPYVTIRKFQQDKMSLRQLVEKQALTTDMAKFLNLVIAMKKNIVVSGGTSSGKTTLLNVMSALIKPDERIVLIEDSSELQLKQEHVVTLESSEIQTASADLKVNIRDLVKASLRMRPDRIVVGEVRGEEAIDLIQAMNTGHGGCLSTIHANSAYGAINRLETLSLMSDVRLPLQALRKQIVAAVDIVVQTMRLPSGQRKIFSITEVVGISDNNELQVEDIYILAAKKTHNKKADSFDISNIEYQHKATGYIPSFFEEALAQGYAVSREMFKKA